MTSPGVEHRLLAHHPGTLDFFDVLQGVGDDPVPADQLNRLRSLVGNADRILEHPVALLWL